MLFALFIFLLIVPAQQESHDELMWTGEGFKKVSAADVARQKALAASRPHPATAEPRVPKSVTIAAAAPKLPALTFDCPTGVLEVRGQRQGEPGFDSMGTYRRQERLINGKATYLRTPLDIPPSVLKPAGSSDSQALQVEERWLYFLPRGEGDSGMYVISERLQMPPYDLALHDSGRALATAEHGVWDVSSLDKAGGGDKLLSAFGGGRMMPAPRVHALCVTPSPTPAPPTPSPPTSLVEV